MSHQSAGDTTTETETSQRNDRELATALRAMALATQDPSPIFKLNVDCWEEIFDWLSAVDLHEFGQTCKFFYRIAGKYFEWKYKNVIVELRGDKMRWLQSKSLKGFSEFTQRLSFNDSEPDTSLLYASENFKSPKELKFFGARLINLDINRLETMLANVEVLGFYCSFRSGESMESILKLCATNLKRLRIGKCTEYDWMYHKYPKLQRLKLVKCNSVAEAAELIRFFERNPNVRCFSTARENILKYQMEFMASNIELDDLTLLERRYSYYTTDGFLTALIDLYKRGFYKRLHFITDTEKHLVDLPGLTTLCIYSDEYFEMPHLPTVTVLSFRPLWNCLRIDMDMDEVSNALINLERILIIKTIILTYMMPFIRNSKKLREIKSDYYHDRDQVLDPVLMQSEREKLNGAHKVIIYVEEKEYLRIKWKYNKSDFGLIEIKRNDSCDGLGSHSFNDLP